MKYSTDYKIREWQGRYKEILDIIDYVDKCDYHMNNDPERCADDLYELGVKLRKRKHMIERYLDDKGTNLY